MNVQVQLITRQEADGDIQENVIESVGTLVAENGSLVLRYTEPKTEDAYGADVCMTVWPERALIERRGPISSHMPLALHQRHPWRYETPYGTMEMPVLCTATENTLTAAGGRYFAVYRVETPGEPRGLECSMEINVSVGCKAKTQ